VSTYAPHTTPEQTPPPSCSNRPHAHQPRCCLCSQTSAPLLVGHPSLHISIRNTDKITHTEHGATRVTPFFALHLFPQETAWLSPAPHTSMLQLPRPQSCSSSSAWELPAVCFPPWKCLYAPTVLKSRLGAGSKSSPLPLNQFGVGQIEMSSRAQPWVC